MKRKISRKHLLDDYRRLKRRLGRQPTAAEFADRHHSIALLCRGFGRPGWRNLLAAAGDEPKRKLDVTRDMLLPAYRGLKKKLGRRPFLYEYEKACYGLWIISRLFGQPGWRRLVEAAGDKPPDRDLTAEHLITDFLKLQQKLGRRPMLIEYRKHCHAPKTLERVFGKPGWRSLILTLGDKAKPGGPLTPEHLIHDYLDAEKALERELTYAAFHLHCGHGLNALNRVFKRPGWSGLQKAVEAARRRKSSPGRTGICAPRRKFAVEATHISGTDDRNSVTL